MTEASGRSRIWRFGVFEFDPGAGELHKNGIRIKLLGQPSDILAMLLERPGQVVTREDIQKKLWPANTFVDFEHSLNAAVKRLRDALDDSAETPRYIETLPRRGYRFIAPVEERIQALVPSISRARRWRLVGSAAALALLLAAAASFFAHRESQPPLVPRPHNLTRLTSGDGLQMEPTWSPDGRFIAYTSDRGGKLDVWVQQVSGGDPVQVTHGPENNWQPAWSPDGKYIAYRSEGTEAGLFITPALGGAGFERRIASFGYKPRWSPDGAQILFQTLIRLATPTNSFYVVGLDGSTPQPVLGEFTREHKLMASVAWQPGGKKISIWQNAGAEAIPSPKFWTASLSGGAATRWKIAPEVVEELEKIGGTTPGANQDYNFSWAPSGKAVYFGFEYRGAKNIWKMSVDLDTLRATSVERLTTGPGTDEEPAVSPDATRLAFAAKSKHRQIWVLPFDAALGRVTGKGYPATSSTLEACLPSLSSDGTKLAFVGGSRGVDQVWEKSLADGQEHPVILDDYFRDFPQWSRDGKRLLYRRFRIRSGITEGQLMVWSETERKEEPLTEWSTAFGLPSDWSADGQWVLASKWGKTFPPEVWEIPIVRTVHAANSARSIVSHPRYYLWQGKFSADGQWVSFNAVDPQPAVQESVIYVAPYAGGSWVRITEDNRWSDKNHWSPDGKTIYYLTDQNGFPNVWGTHFDPAAGRPRGKPFQVTAFNMPSLRLFSMIEAADFSVTNDKLAVTLEQASGSIWILDNVDR